MKELTATEIGSWGESRAREFLLKLGYEILETNWRWKRYEIDLIAKDRHTLVFVEVKVRKTAAFGHPESFVDMPKSRRIKQASVEYQILHGYEGFIRFDIVSITGYPERFAIHHAIDAF